MVVSVESNAAARLASGQEPVAGNYFVALYSDHAVRLTRPGLLRVDRLLPHFYDPPFRDLRYS